MAIDFSQRPSGMSKREYAASILGGSRDDYDSSGNKISSSSSSSSGSTYKAKTYDYKDFVDTKSISKAYDSAKSVYTDQLAALKPRYEELYKQLEAEKQLASEKEAAQFAEEGTQQKVNLAKRGVSTDTSNQFYTTEAGKLEKQQNIQSRETALEYAGKRLDISSAQSADERDLNTAIANLGLSKATTIQSIVTDAKKYATQLTTESQNKALETALWNKTYEYTKSKDAADLALRKYIASKNSGTLSVDDNGNITWRE